MNNPNQVDGPMATETLTMSLPTQIPVGRKKFIMAWLLALFLGATGADKFYLGKKVSGWIRVGLMILIIPTLFVSLLVAMVWGWIDLIKMLRGRAIDSSGFALAGYAESKLLAILVSIPVLLIQLLIFFLFIFASGTGIANLSSTDSNVVGFVGNQDTRDSEREAEAIAAESARVAEEKRLAAEAKRAEEARLAQEARIAEEARLAEEARIAEETRIAEEARVAAEVEAARVAEANRVAAEQAAAAAAQAERDAAASPVYYPNCTAVRNAGAAPISAGQPGYGSHLDRDGDGVACET